MPRQRRDGNPSRTVNKRKLTPLYVAKVRPEARSFLVWDTVHRGLALSVRKSGRKGWKVVYSFHGRVRWYHIADAAAIGLAEARQLAAEVMFEVAKGNDPQATKRANRGAETFAEMH